MEFFQTVEDTVFGTVVDVTSRLTEVEVWCLTRLHCLQHLLYIHCQNLLGGAF